MAELRLIEQAQQGDPQAIAALMNQSLQPKGMTATVERQGDALEIKLEADRIPNRQALTAFVEKGIHNLGIASIRSIRILGQQTGASFPAWMQELPLNAPMPDAALDAAMSSSSPSGAGDPSAAIDLSPDFLANDEELNSSAADLQFSHQEFSGADTSEPLQVDLQSLWNEQTENQSEDFLQELMESEAVGADRSLTDASLGLQPDELSQMPAEPASADFDALQDLFGEGSDPTSPAADLNLFDSIASDVSIPPAPLEDINSLADLFGDESLRDAVLGDELLGGESLGDELPADPNSSASDRTDPDLQAESGSSSEIPDPWSNASQTDLSAEFSTDLSDLSTDFLEAPPESAMQDSAPDDASMGMLDDLFADTPSEPATTGEMEFNSAAVPLTSVDDLLSALGDEPSTSDAAPDVDLLMVADLNLDFDEPKGDRLNLDDADATLSGEFDAFSAEEPPDAETSEPLIVAEEFFLMEMSEEPQLGIADSDVSDFDVSNFDIADSTNALEDFFTSEESGEETAEPLILVEGIEEMVVIEETIEFEASDLLSEETFIGAEGSEDMLRFMTDEESAEGFAADAGTMTPEEELFGLDAEPQGSSESPAIDEMMFAVASEPLDVDSLEFGTMASEALDANLMDVEPEAEPDAESLSFLDEMAAETEMPPAVTLEDQWLESSSSGSSLFEEPVAPEVSSEDLGLENFTSDEPGDESPSAESDLFAPADSDAPATIDFSADPFIAAEETPEATAQDFSADFLADATEETPAIAAEGLPTEDFPPEEFVVDDVAIEEPSPAADSLAEPLMNPPVAEPSAESQAEGDRDQNPELDARLDLSSWFDDQIEVGDPAAELSIAPSEDFLTQEDAPGYTLGEYGSQMQAADDEWSAEALFDDVPLEDVPSEPTFTPEADLLAVDSLTQEDVPSAEAIADSPEVTALPEMTPQIEAQIDNLFAQESDSVTEASFQNSWEYQTDDVSDDSADTEAPSSTFAFLEEPAADSSEATDLTLDRESEITGINETTSEASILPEGEFSNLSFLTEMPGIDLPDDQVNPASAGPLATETGDLDASLFDELRTESADDPDVSLANTLSLSEAMDPQELQASLQDDFPDSDFPDSDFPAPDQEDFGDPTVFGEAPSLEELSDEQLQELLGAESEDFAIGDPAQNNLPNEASSEDQPVVSEESMASPFPEEGVAASGQEPLIDFLNRQFGLEEETPTVEEPPEPDAEPDAEPDTLRETSGEAEPVALSGGTVPPTELPFAAMPFAAESMTASSPEALASDEPELSLDLSDDWMESSSPATSSELASGDSVQSAETPARQERSQEELERQLEASDFVQPVGQEAYDPARTTPEPPPREVSVTDRTESRPASSGLFTLILFTIVGFIAALLGFSLWSQLTAPPEPQPVPSPAAPPSPEPPAASPAVPPAQTAPPAASPAAPPAVPPAASPAAPVAPPAPPAPPAAAPPASPVAPAPEASPVAPAAPVAPAPEASPAPASPAAPPASPSPAT